MRISYLWLKSLVDFSLTPDELAAVLTMAGLEVGDLQPVGPNLEGVYVGQVLEVKPHPQAEKLTICKVNIGTRAPEVVCGAPNVEVGQKVPFIGAGSTMPDGTPIEARSIRGVPSEGMICSGLELGLNEDGEGILVLDPSAEVGLTLQELIGPGDWALDLEVTINRPDCLCHIGVGREVAAALGIDLRLPKYSVNEAGPPIEDITSVTIEEPKFCPRYSARVIRGVKIAPSPDWMRWRLEAAGLRAINNVVDVTNYVMLETGHPMHAFDFNRLEGRRIVVRRATAGERFTTLDGIERRLDDQMLLICDARQGVALAGVMGGENSEISDQTQDLLLESAYFDPINTRRTSKFLNLVTDSARRFERGADPNVTVRALDMAASLIVELAGGEAAFGVADVYPEPIRPRQIELRPRRVQAILGVEILGDEMRDHLSRLGCEMDDGEPLKVTVPTFRPDLEREIDLIEEVARLHGYDRVPAAERASIQLDAPAPAAEVFEEKLRSTLVKLGYSQVITSPLLAPDEVDLPGYPPAVKLRNPASEDMAYLRNGLLPGLLEVASHNTNRGMADLRLFEIGRIFRADAQDGAEWDAAAGLLIGSSDPLRWDKEKELGGFLDLKGTVEDLLREISLDKHEFIYYNIEGAERYTADVAEVCSPEISLGIIGQLHPRIASAFDIDVAVFGFEFEVAALRQASRDRLTYQPFPKFPPLQRDLAFTLAEDVATGNVMARIREVGGDNLVSCELFDVYRGSQIGVGQKSLAFRLNFQSQERTLRDEEADESIKAIVHAIEKGFNAKLRA